MWLAGDAAHMTGPVGMQSMNVGLFEAHDLAGILARILRQRSTADELAAYERTRHRRNTDRYFDRRIAGDGEP